MNAMDLEGEKLLSALVEILQRVVAHGLDGCPVRKRQLVMAGLESGVWPRRTALSRAGRQSSEAAV